MPKPAESLGRLNTTVAERDAQLRWLMLLRVAVATAVLLATLYIQFLAGTEFRLRPLFGVIGTVYGVSLLFAISHRRGIYWQPYVGIQLSTDVVLESLLIYFMGGVGSPFVVLYLLTVGAAGFMMTRRGAIYLAAFTVVCYGLVGLSVYVLSPLLEFLPAQFEEAFRSGLAGSRVEATELYLRLFSLLLVSYGLAWGSSAMAARLRQTGRELRARSSQVEALRRLNERIIHGMTSGLLATDPEGNVVTFNSAAEEITGRQAEELLGRKVWEVFGTEPDLLERLDERLQHKRIYRTQRPLHTRGGGWRTIGMTVTRMETADIDVHQVESVYVFMFRDLTEIKRMERELRIRDRMSVLGEMAGSIAHEIRNPLASISGSLQLLGRSNISKEDPNTAELMGIVVKESDRLSRTIDQFLEYARPVPFDPEETDLLELARATIALLSNSSELSPDHRLEIDAQDDAYVAMVDPGQIKQVFWNLARNAIQAMPQGGALVVGLDKVPQGIEVAFSDNGKGMTPEDIESFFQPYVSGSARGTGLGLSVVYRVLERHGVIIEVDSELGEGSRFILTFVEHPEEEAGRQLVLLGERRARQGSGAADARLTDRDVAVKGQVSAVGAEVGTAETELEGLDADAEHAGSAEEGAEPDLGALTARDQG